MALMDWYLLIFLIAMAVVSIALGYAAAVLVQLNRKGGGVPKPEGRR